MVSRSLAAVAAAVLTLGMAGCSTPQDYNAARGAVIGGSTGALIGGLATGRPGGALAGALIGGAGGTILGAAATPQPLPVEGPPPRCARMGYDEYGEPVCLKLAGYPRY